MILVRLVRRRDELLQQPPNGIAVRPHPPFFDYYVSLFVELAHHRMQKSLRFHVRPQLQPVGRHRVVIGRLIFIGERVQPLCAIALQNARILIRHHIFLRLSNRVLPLLLQLFQFLVARAIHIRVPHISIRRVIFLHSFERNLLGGIVGRSDLVRSFEGHVLEHVRHSGLPGWVLHRACINMVEERKHRRLRPLVHDRRQPVVEFLDRNVLLKSCQVLRDRCRAQQEDRSRYLKETLSHRTSARLDARNRQKSEVTCHIIALSNVSIYSHTRTQCHPEPSGFLRGARDLGRAPRRRMARAAWPARTPLPTLGGSPTAQPSEARQLSIGLCGSLIPSV